VDRHARRRSRQPNIRSLLNLCALQGIDIDAFLAAPVEASSPWLFDQWAGFDYLPLPTATKAQNVFVATKVLEDFVASRPAYFPPIAMLFKPFHIQQLIVRDMRQALFEIYQNAYESPGPHQVEALRKAYVYASQVVVAPGLDATSRRTLAEKVADVTQIDLNDALIVIESASVVRVLHARDRVEAYRAKMPLRRALEWLAETRGASAYCR
jgi:hypothetical protein